MSQRLGQSVAGLLTIAWFFTASPLMAGTGGDPQTPNLASGRFLQPGAPGLCQCIAVDVARALSCHASAGMCETFCASRLYSFVPDANQSCPGTPPVTQPTS
jgi:hypothetical protein